MRRSTTFNGCFSESRARGAGTAVWFTILRAVSLLVVPLLGLAIAKDRKHTPFPTGFSTQVLGEREYEIIVPPMDAPARKLSLVLAIHGDGTPIAKKLASVVGAGFVVCSPRTTSTGKHAWATSAAKEILELVDHVATRVDIDRKRIHVVSIEDFQGFSTFVAFAKKSGVVSYCLVGEEWKGKSPPKSARKQVAVLSLGTAVDPNGNDRVGAIMRLEDKFRTLEHRDEPLQSDYFRYWLHVADGRYVPGYDRSLAWIAGAAAEPDAAPNEAGGETEERGIAIDVLRRRARTEGKASMIYFFAEDDVDGEDGRALQNKVFFDREIRARCADLLVAKIDRSQYADEFSEFGLSTTPALVMLDEEFNVKAIVEGSISDSRVLSALKRVTSKPARNR